jgi:hypothetical protein
VPARLILHDRRMPGSRANIDHIAVVPSGVYIIDSKRYKGRNVRVATPLLGSPKLVIDGRDRTKLVDGLLGQVEAVTRIVAALDPDVPVRGAFCFVDAHLPLLGTPRIRGVPVLGRKGPAKHINCDGPLTDDQIRAIAAGLAGKLQPA